jgi:DNA-binding MarR family transcriptional regulator
MEHSLAEVGISAAQYSVLSILELTPAVSSAEIARVSSMRRQSVHGLITTLENKGLVERVAVEHDRRQLAISLTTAGYEALGRATPRVRALEAAILAGYNPRQEKLIRQWLVMSAQRLALLDAVNGAAEM